MLHSDQNETLVLNTPVRTSFAGSVELYTRNQGPASQRQINSMVEALLPVLSESFSDLQGYIVKFPKSLAQAQTSAAGSSQGLARHRGLPGRLLLCTVPSFAP